MKKIGIIGGSFNPIHIAHLIIAERFIEQVGLDKCVFIPAFTSPFKATEVSEFSISAQARLDMLRLAVESNPNFVLDDFEIRREGISYTFETVLYFIKKYPDTELNLLIGADQAIRFTEWRNWQKILQNVKLCIVSRPGVLDEDSQNEFLNKLNLNISNLIIVDAPLLDISSSEIRNRVNSKSTIKYLVPHSVENYIQQHKLYTNS